MTTVSIETTALYQEMMRRVPDIPAGPRDPLSEFERLRSILQEHGKYIVLLFPEYTPHDHTRHLDQLFALSDRILGTPLYMRLGPVELVLLAFGLYAHDWGMVVSEEERQSLITGAGGNSFALLPDEPSCAQAFFFEANLAGISPEAAWRDYLRRTHALRSGARLRKYLEPLGSVFADAVAKIAEGHTLSLREVRDTDRYPLGLSVFGEAVNLAALTTYVRMVDLFDIGEDRTPYALWKFVSPADPISSMEWRKHRAVSPVSVKSDHALREVLVSGYTDDPGVFAALADLRSWIDEEFAMSMALLRTISGKYNLDLSSRINWNIEAFGFEPLIVRFELDRPELLSLLSKELYQGDPLAFIRELLQNSVDAIDLREALLARHGLRFEGEIRIRITSGTLGLYIEWADNGIGMDKDVLSSYFARLGCSWYRSREASRLGQIDAISRFGVGILSCFAVSHTLTVETQIDPNVGGTRPGLAIEIPSSESHFHIRTTASKPVGTTIRLEIPPPLTAVVSKESVCASLTMIARYVRHRITVDSDGVVTEAGFLGRMVVNGAGIRSVDDQKISIRGMRGDSTEKLSSMTATVAFEFGDPASNYHGHYSTIVPKRPNEVRTSVDSSVWFLEGERIELDDVVTDSEQTLFVKGIQTGPVTGPLHRGQTNSLSLSRHTGWINPKLLLNVRHPSYLEFNLARSAVRLKSRDWLEMAWKDIAKKLRTNTFNWPITNAGDTAIMLGSCAIFGAVPDFGLESLVEKHELPLIVIRPGEGPKWRILREFLHGEEFLEAPFELAYVLAQKDTFEIGSSSGLEGWEGDDVLFPAEGYLSSYRYPWLGTIHRYGYRTLKRLGWCPVEIRLVRPPANETVPLVCRVWRNVGVGHHDDDLSEEWSRKENWHESWAIMKNLYKDPSGAPEIFRFPDSFMEYAAMGSRYWNIDHPKIKRIIATITVLTDRMRQQKLSPDGLRAVQYLTSHTFYDWVVPSRMSGVTLAIELPNRLLDVAEEEGLAGADRLVSNDFVPGTVEGYKNPYHYDLSGWEIRGTGLGQRLD